MIKNSIDHLWILVDIFNPQKGPGEIKLDSSATLGTKMTVTKQLTAKAIRHAALLRRKQAFESWNPWFPSFMTLVSIPLHPGLFLSTRRAFIYAILTNYLLYGIYATLYFTYIAHTVSRKRTSGCQNVLFAIGIVVFVASTTNLILMTEYILLQIPAFRESSQIQMEPKNDGVVVWRAWILCNRGSFVTISLALCMLACVGTMSEFGIWASNMFTTYGDYHHSSELLLLFTVPLLVTNLYATVLVGCVAWQHLRLRKNLGCSSSSSSKVVFTILLIKEDRTSLSVQIFLCAMPFVAAIYPIAIPLLVALQWREIDTVVMTRTSAVNVYDVEWADRALAHLNARALGQLAFQQDHNSIIAKVVV
ncbi:hypothetical protein K435DRAFT_940789 [Dendrothele bispora CBS 962.96]|uniref:Uncharacterized protein n=1 Tax=Dendrothele bispora (strain CBS 962.96) TaxID=1314807 RepID=A0A4S8MTV1_DENBC|nr:hypothetical protein K435DRAFT_940789 [Dendrothele bispora CBS 962.96]